VAPIESEPIGRSGRWTPPARRRPIPRPFNEAAERDGEDLGGFAQDGFGGL